MSTGMQSRPGSTQTSSQRLVLSRLGKARLAGEILAAYVKARWWLRRHGLEETVSRLRGAVTIEGAPGPEQVRSGIKLGRIVEKTLSVLPADSRCLVRSLVLTSLLGRRGIASTFVIGGTSEPQFEGHAWIECAGVQLLPAGEAANGRLVEL
jgi:Transglutaminase-like superfamily